MKVFDGFASPRWSEAEPGAGRKKMGVPGGGQQKPLTGDGVPIGNGVPIVSRFARRGDSLRGVLSRMSRIKIGNGIGIGLGFGMFAPLYVPFTGFYQDRTK